MVSAPRSCCVLIDEGDERLAEIEDAGFWRSSYEFLGRLKQQAAEAWPIGGAIQYVANAPGVVPDYITPAIPGYREPDTVLPPRPSRDEGESWASFARRLHAWHYLPEVVAACQECARGTPVDHFGDLSCRSGSLASGGTRPHCTCDGCW